MEIVVVDSGTSTTRARLWRDDGVAWSGTRQAGARDTAVDGHPDRIRSALRELIAELLVDTGAAPQAAVCSGMITSNVGLLDVPHLTAPASVERLVGGLVRRDMPDIADLPFYFVPGVKTLPGAASLEALADADLLRGEEAEVLGLRESLGLEAPALFLHFGSHHKAIATDAAGSILGSRTAITGELLEAIGGHTILKSSVVPVEALDLDLELARAGLASAEVHGLGRTLFLVRVGEQLGGRSRGEMTSFLIGALAHEDLALLRIAEPGVPVVLYGKGAFQDVLADHIEREGREVVSVDPDAADLAAARGAARLFEMHVAAREPTA